jgi:hypothetical protein
MACVVAAAQPPASAPPLPPRTRAVLESISASSLRGHLSFIASDLLEGRATPSRGLDVAAEYIAAQFRRAGLEPVGDDGYFQTADMLELETAKSGFEMKVEQAGRVIQILPEEITPRFHSALDLRGVEIYKLDAGDQAALRNLKPEDVQDKVVLTELPELSGAASGDTVRKYRRLLRAVERAKPKLTLLLTRDGLAELNTRLVHAEDEASHGPARIMVRSPEALAWYQSLKPGASTAILTLRLPEPVESHVKLRNVIGLLRGSDAQLGNTYVLVSAHYDHLGVRSGGTGNGIFNGANDDGSGTVSVIELASALAGLQPRPRRSLVFLTFFGEEEGTLGSLYYVRHPVFPLENTVADVNLEQVGRTDATDGAKRSQATFTGFHYSDLPGVFQAAGARTGVRVLSDDAFGDSFFTRSDNQPFAMQGVPAHTLAVAFEFPDYHQVGDKWQKIDYDNMARVDRMLALGLILLADNPQPPRWNEDNPGTSSFVKAWRKHHAAR